MSQVVVDNRTDGRLSDVAALRLVVQVMEQGRVEDGERSYAMNAMVVWDGAWYDVAAWAGRCSDEFVVRWVEDGDGGYELMVNG